MRENVSWWCVRQILRSFEHTGREREKYYMYVIAWSSPLPIEEFFTALVSFSIV